MAYVKLCGIIRYVSHDNFRFALNCLPDNLYTE